MKNDRLVGLVVKAFAKRAANLGSVFSFGVDLFPDQVIPVSYKCPPVATLPGAWRYRVSAGTGWSGVSVL